MAGLEAGIHFDTRMTVARLGDGSVWIASPVPVPFATLTEITDLGPVRYLVAPTPRHFWRLNASHQLFPEAELWSSPITPITLKKGDLPLTGILGDHVRDLWAGDLDQVVLRGSRWLNEVIFFHAATRTLLLEDVIQIHQPQAGHTLRNALIALGSVAAPRRGARHSVDLPGQGFSARIHRSSSAVELRQTCRGARTSRNRRRETNGRGGILLALNRHPLALLARIRRGW
jgi:hypothetical protein